MSVHLDAVLLPVAVVGFARIPVGVSDGGLVQPPAPEGEKGFYFLAWMSFNVIFCAQYFFLFLFQITSKLQQTISVSLNLTGCVQIYTCTLALYFYFN